MMIDYEKKQEGLKFGDLVRYKSDLHEVYNWKYVIYVNEDAFDYNVTDGKGYFFTVHKFDNVKDTLLERIGSVMDKNIIDLIPKS